MTQFSEETCKLMIDMFDGDRSGTIDLREFGMLFDYINQWRNAFTSFDRDRSGSIDEQELGQAMTIMIKRADGVIYPVIVPLNATVQDLKKEIERYVTLQLTREEEGKPISWRYIWKTYWLVFNGVKLKDLNMMLKDIGLSNRSEVHFIKRLQPK